MDGEFVSRSAVVGFLDLYEPAARRLPLVLASPHSGSEYPADFVAASRLDPLALRRSEDSFVDELFAAAPQLGAPLLSARFPRAYLDVNREAYELDPTMFSDALPSYVNAGSPRVRIGLGTIARIVASGENIYAGKLRFADAERRVECLYHPYHQVLRRLVQETAGMFGGYLLVDCHSMPSSSGCGQDGADIVLGDCYGAACAPRILETACRFLAERGFKVAINAPYAGGFTTGFYGRPSAHRHALQIEINRALYMDERSYCRKPNFARLVEHLADLVERLGQATQDCLPKQPEFAATIDAPPRHSYLRGGATAGGRARSSEKVDGRGSAEF
jgi:N-formylglutamate amidohydrolase